MPAPADERDDNTAGSCAHPPPPPRPASADPRRIPRLRVRYSWAELLQRVFLVDVLTCDRCGGRRKLLAAITEPKAIRDILAHVGLPTEPPLIAAARAPPGELFG